MISSVCRHRGASSHKLSRLCPLWGWCSLWDHSPTGCLLWIQMYVACSIIWFSELNGSFTHYKIAMAYLQGAMEGDGVKVGDFFRMIKLTRVCVLLLKEQCQEALISRLLMVWILHLGKSLASWPELWSLAWKSTEDWAYSQVRGLGSVGDGGGVFSYPFIQKIHLYGIKWCPLLWNDSRN